MTGDGLGLLHDDERHLDGHAARRRRGRDPRPAAPGLDRRAAQGRADEQRAQGLDGVHAVPGRHRPGRRRRRGARRTVRATGSALLRQLPLAARADRRRRRPRPHLHQRRRRGRSPSTSRPTSTTQRQPSPWARSRCRPTSVVPAGGKASVDRHRRPAGRRPGPGYVGWVVATDHTTGDPVTRTSLGLDSRRTSATTSPAGHRPRRAARPDVRDGGRAERLGPAVRPGRRRDHRADASRHLLGHRLHGRQGRQRARCGPGGRPRGDALRRPHGRPERAGGPPGDGEVAEGGAVATWRQMEWHVTAGGGFGDMGRSSPDLDDHMYAQSTDPVETGGYSFAARWRLRRDYVAVRVGTRAVDSLMAIDSGWVHRAADTTLAYAGAGTPAEFDAAHVRGKIAVVSLDTDTIDVSPFAAAAAERGAKALLVVNHQPGRFLPFAGPTYGVRADLGRRRQRRRGRLAGPAGRGARRRAPGRRGDHAVRLRPAARDEGAHPVVVAIRAGEIRPRPGSTPLPGARGGAGGEFRWGTPRSRPRLSGRCSTRRTRPRGSTTSRPSPARGGTRRDHAGPARLGPARCPALVPTGPACPRGLVRSGREPAARRGLLGSRASGRRVPDQPAVVRRLLVRAQRVAGQRRHPSQVIKL